MSENIFVDLENQIAKVKKELNNLENMFNKLKKNYKKPVIESKNVVNNFNPHYKINVTISKELSSLLNCSTKISMFQLTKHIVSYIKGGDNDVSLLKKELRLSENKDISFYNLQKVIEKNIRRIANGVAMTHGCEVDVIYERVFIPLVNHPDATRHCLEVAEKVFGVDRVNGNAARMGASEDFARALEIVPGAFGNIGNGDSAPLHSSKYDFNDDALIHGVRWFTELVRTRLPIAS